VIQFSHPFPSEMSDVSAEKKVAEASETEAEQQQQQQQGPQLVTLQIEAVNKKIISFTVPAAMQLGTCGMWCC
jgi:hypothetical protein